MSLGNPKTQKQAARLERDELRQVVADMKAVMSSEPGRRFVHRLIFDMGNVLDVPLFLAVKDGHSASLHTYAALGRQDLARDLLEDLQAHCPDLWDQMIRERLDRQEADRSRIEKTTASAEVNDHGTED